MVGQRTPGSFGYSQKKIFTTALDETSTVDIEGLGALRWEGPKCYKWVKYNSGTGAVAAVAGNVVYYHGDDGLEDVEVTMDLTDAILGAGVLQAIIANGSYGWIQIKGLATVTTALTAGADGNALTPIGSTDGTLDVSALVTDHVCAYAMDASAKKIYCDFPY